MKWKLQPLKEKGKQTNKHINFELRIGETEMA